MRIALVVGSLRAGGAERAALLLAAGLASLGNEVHLVTYEGEETDFYPTDPLLNRHVVGHVPPRNKREIPSKTFLAYRSLRSEISSIHPDALISMVTATNVLALLAARPLNIPVLIVEQIDPSQHPIDRWWDVLRRATYRWATGLVVLSNRIRPWAEKRLPPNRVHVIPNPISVAEIGGPLPVGDRHFVAMGRLAHQKGFDLLLDAFARTESRHRGWRLTILGEGPLRPDLEKQARVLGIDGEVSFPGLVASPWDRLRRHAVFVFSSRYEGFGLALVEAMACGLACVSFDCPSGPADILSDGVDGRVVPPGDVDALARSMDQVASDPSLRRRLGAAAAVRAKDFEPEVVARQYLRVLSDAVGPPALL